MTVSEGNAETAAPSASSMAAEDDREAKQHVYNVMSRSGTSFAWGMRILPRAGREAMYAIYAFCREIDDIADEGGTTAEKKTALDAWRIEIDRLYNGQPQKLTARALHKPIKRFDLPKSEFIMLIEGMQIDAEGSLRAPKLDTLLHYCRRVAGAVGLLSMRVFEAPRGAEADRFALSLANALQFTNILRDLEEDADRNRLYLPQELLRKHGIASGDPKSVLSHANLGAVCADMATLAEGHFADSRRALAHFDWRRVRPAMPMMGVYEGYLHRMIDRGWSEPTKPVTMPKALKVATALRYAVSPPL